VTRHFPKKQAFSFQKKFKIGNYYFKKGQKMSRDTSINLHPPSRVIW